MRVAVIGSRGITVENLQDYLPEGTTEIISGGAKGVDSCAREYAVANNIPLTEFKPEYSRYGRGAPLKRNITIIENAQYRVVSIGRTYYFVAEIHQSTTANV